MRALTPLSKIKHQEQSDSASENRLAKKAPLVVTFVAIIVSISTTFWAYKHNAILAYGDAAQHVNIAKRIVDGLTPGIAQFGSVWLPLPHLLYLPLVWNDTLWRTGLAGAAVSMAAYVLSSILIFKIARLIGCNNLGAALASGIFIFNPNVAYLQATPMGELPLIAALLASAYFFTRWMETKELMKLVAAALFGAAGTLIRYDAWLFVLVESVLILTLTVMTGKKLRKAEGRAVLHGTLAYSGIVIWLFWNLIIFGNPFNFTLSQYSARSQQIYWLRQGKLLTYHNLPLSVLYYVKAVILNAGIVVGLLGLAGFVYFSYDLIKRKNLFQLAVLLMVSPFIFYVLSLVFGQAIMLIPGLTPNEVGRGLFNARYGLMMMPFLSLAIAKITFNKKALAIVFLAAVLGQYAHMAIASDVATYQEGTKGIASRTKNGPNETEHWMQKNYNGGLILLNNYYGAVEILNLKVPMDKIIYEGSYKYWQESLIHPAAYARWIILRKSSQDPLWRSFEHQRELTENFDLVFISGETQVYKGRGQ